MLPQDSELACAMSLGQQHAGLNSCLAHWNLLGSMLCTSRRAADDASNNLPLVNSTGPPTCTHLCCTGATQARAGAWSSCKTAGQRIAGQLR